MEARAEIPVTLPHPRPTSSYWHTLAGAQELANHRGTDELPERADYVIVGSGITGASIALNLLAKRPHASVVMLEARGACGGASGRNGGHTKAASYRAFTGIAKQFGDEEALRVAHLERANIQATHAFAAAHPEAACDSHPCRSVDVVYCPKQWEASVGAIELMRKLSAAARAEGKPFADVDQYELYGPDEASARYHVERVPELQGAIEYDAGSINAYALVLGMLDVCVRHGLNLQTHTTVSRISRVEDGKGHANGHSNGSTNGVTNGTVNNNSNPNGTATDTRTHTPWVIETSRGAMTAGQLILATNGYTAALDTRFQGVIVPLRGQITAQRPGRSLPHNGSLRTTYSLIYASGYEYMITRPAGTVCAGDIVIGGGWGAMADGGTTQFGECDDSVVQDDIGAYLRECTVRYFGAATWGHDAPEGRVRHEWSGIMGTSADGRPYVGQVPGEAAGGLWVCASFNGHGMALCLKSAEGLVAHMVGSDEDKEQLDAWFPRCFWVTEQRLAGARFTGRKAMV